MPIIYNICMVIILIYIVACIQLGPEKGVMHLATGALVNAYWDLWAKIEKKPLWKLLVDMVITAQIILFV